MGNPTMSSLSSSSCEDAVVVVGASQSQQQQQQQQQQQSQQQQDDDETSNNRQNRQNGKNNTTTTTTTTTNNILPGQDKISQFMSQLQTASTAHSYLKDQLPMICVMGDTSSGKSSLLSALSMVELPSSNELTTKCPVMLYMTHHALRQTAIVTIQWNDTDNDTDTDNTTHTTHFEPIEVHEENWDKLPGAILEAQDFILNEHHHHHSSSSSSQISLDRVVVVHVQGPQYVFDLTLCDLPGMARVRGDCDGASLVDDVTALLQPYLENPRCILLAVVPSNVEYHNSHILGLLQQKNNNDYEARTIPVLTKPDLIDVGAEQQIVDLLMGRTMKNFTLGFHIVKGRGQAQLDAAVSLEQSLQEEETYFNTVEPWKSLEERHLMGTASLRHTLADLQLKMLRDCIPSILKDIHTKQQVAFAKLVDMGSVHCTMADKRRYYQDSVQAFLSHLKGTLSGRGPTKKTSKTSAASKLHDACAVFKTAIRQGSLATIKAVVEGAQVLVTSPKGDVRGEVVHVDGRFACVDFVDDKDHAVDVLFDYVGYISKEVLDVDDVWSDGNKVYIARSNNSFDLLRPIPMNRIRSDPAWLEAKIAENRTDDLACFLNIDIFKSIVCDFIEIDWRPHCDVLMNQTNDICLAAVSESLRQEYIRYPALQSLIQTQASHAARALLLTAEQQVKAHLTTEHYPYTQDDTLLQNIANARHASLKRSLEVALRLDSENSSSSSVYDGVAIQSILDSVFDRTKTQTVEQQMAQDMEIVLESYGKISTKRVIDRTPMICWEVFRSLVPAIQEVLFQITDADLQQVMQDDPKFQQEHLALTKELEEMNAALTLFQSMV